MSDNRAQICPECGAAQVDGMDCWGQLGTIIAWEAQDPDLAAEHFLTVACYNLQHPTQFKDEAISWLRAALMEYVDHGTPAIELRRRAARSYRGKRRVLRHESERKPVLRPWPVTIADIYIPDEPQGAAERVGQWAASIRESL